MCGLKQHISRASSICTHTCLSHAHLHDYTTVMDPPQPASRSANRRSRILRWPFSSPKTAPDDIKVSVLASENRGTTTDTALTTISTVAAIVQNVSGALSNVPFVGAVANLVLYILEAYEEVESNDQACKELIVKVATISQMVFECLQKVGNENKMNEDYLGDFMNDLEQYQQILKNIEKALQKATSKRKRDRLNRTIDRSSFASLIQGYNRELDEFRSLFDTKMLTQLTINSAKAALNSSYGNNSHAKFHSWLAPPDPSTNYNLAIEKRLESTGDWLSEYDKYVTWRDVGGSILWFYGIPGAGKTFLCSTAIEDVNRLCQPSTITLARFYFDFKDKSKQTTSSLLRSLLVQFAIEHPSAVNNLYTRCKEGNQQPSTKEMIETLRDTIRRFKKAYIIIDALDECTEVEMLMKLLGNITQWGLASVHILVTSRKEVEIEQGFETLPVTLVDIQRTQVQEDIVAYIRTRLRTEREFKKWSEEDTKMIEETLQTGVNGMFRWAACQLDLLRRCLNRADLKKTLLTLPKTLDETYERILSQIDEGHRRHVHETLRFLAFSMESVSIESVVEFLAIDLECQPWPRYDPDLRISDPDDLLKICSSLVVRTEPYTNEYRINVPACLQLAHFSVKEYLISCRGNDTFFHLNETSSHILIAQRCLAYRLEFYGDEAHFLTKDYRFQSYSATLWPNHISAAGGNPPETLMPLIMELLRPDRPHYADWAHCCKLFPEPPPSPLYFVAKFGLTSLIRVLLDNGANVNEGHSCYFPLYIASEDGRLDVVKLLLQYGADVNKWDRSHGGALEIASYQGHEEIVNVLLEHGAIVNTSGRGRGCALLAASEGVNINIVRKLLEHGADVNWSKGGGSALQLACLYGSDDLVKLLLEHGADVNAPPKYYPRALKIALIRGSETIVDMLLEHGAEREESESSDATPEYCYPDYSSPDSDSTGNDGVGNDEMDHDGIDSDWTDNDEMDSDGMDYDRVSPKDSRMLYHLLRGL